MKKILISFCIILSSLTSYATDAKAKSDELTDQEKEQTYIYQCGSLQEVVSLVNANTKDLKDAEIKELIESRKSTLSVIRGGKEAIQQLLDQGGKDGMAGLGVLLVCGVIDQVADKIQERGCLDLETNEVVKAGEGVKLCQDAIAGIKKK